MRITTLSRRRSEGFTLIELLVVISIIAVLAALTAGAVFRVQASQSLRRTEQNLTKLGSIMEQQWLAVCESAKKEQDIIKKSHYFTLCGNDGDRTLSVWTKIRLRQEFPQSFAEARWNPQPPLDQTGQIIRRFAKPNYVSYLGSASGGTAEDQSAVCLYMALTQARAGMTAFDPEQALSGAVSTRVVGGRSFKIFVDGWGTPITFVRWPRGNDDLNAPPYLTNPSRPDPQDPFGKLINFSQPTLEGMTHPFNPARNLVPVIISAGPNRLYGIDHYMNITNAAQESDNLYSYRLRRDGN